MKRRLAFFMAVSVASALGSLATTASAQNLPPPPPPPPNTAPAEQQSQPAPAPAEPAPLQAGSAPAQPTPPPPAPQPSPAASPQYPAPPAYPAQAYPPPPASDANSGGYAAPLWISIAPREPNLYIELIPEPELAWRRQPVVRCRTNCTVSLLPGKYKLRVTRPGEPSTDRTIRIEEPERLTVGAANPGASSAGMALGIVGPAMIVLSTVLIFSQLDCRYDTRNGDNGCDAPDWVPGVALIGIVGGVALTPIGWVMFARNKRPSLDRTSMPYPQASTKPQFGIGTFNASGGGGVRFGVVF